MPTLALLGALGGSGLDVELVQDVDISLPNENPALDGILVQGQIVLVSAETPASNPLLDQCAAVFQTP